jgi:class 3 adenylate cyclase
MTFSEIVDQASALLQRKQRITYRTLKREFHLDDEALEDLKCELIDGQRVAIDEDGKVLVWKDSPATSIQRSESEGQEQASSGQTLDPGLRDPRLDASERRQLTVLFCDLVGFTELATRVDPEVLQGIIRSYEDTCAVCVTRYEGYVYQRLGDGIVAFFGYPLAHEGEAERAIHAGLAIIESLATLAVPEVGRLHVRLGIATGVVVVAGGGAGGGGRDPESRRALARDGPGRQHCDERAGASVGRGYF